MSSELRSKMLMNGNLILSDIVGDNIIQNIIQTLHGTRQLTVTRTLLRFSEIVLCKQKNMLKTKTSL
jgi:hypothetical protein